MRRYFLRALGAHWRHHRTLFLLSAFGVALGVASVLSIQILNANALAAFSGSLEAVSGEADLTVLGRLPALDESLYPKVLGAPGVQGAWPLWRRTVALRGRDRFFLEVIGVDFFAPMQLPVSGVGEGGERQEAAEEFLRGALLEPGWVAVTPELAGEMGWAEGDTFAVSSGSRSVTLRVGARIDFRSVAPLADPRMMVMDIAQAQNLFGRPGEIHQIDVTLRPDADLRSTARRLEERLGPAAMVRTPEQREQQAAGLLAAFRLNLTALSLISLFVGVFLVYTTTQASLQRRRREFGLLRSLGATRGQVLGLILGEALLLGAVGTAAGLPLGYHAARANVDLVSSTLSNLYLLQGIASLRLPRSFFLLAAAIGLGGALAGGIVPALDMSRRRARSLLVPFGLHERIRTLAGGLAAAALVLLAAAGGWFQLWGRTWRMGGFLLGAVLMVALPLLTPLLIQAVVGRIRPARFDLGFALKGLSARLQTSAFAVAALGVAVSMLFGVTLLIAGFRRTVDTWVGASVQADVYVTPESWARGRSEAALDDSLRAALAAWPGVRAVDVLRQFLAWSGDRQITVNGVDVTIEAGESRFLLVAGDLEEARRRMRAGEILVSEPLARKERLAAGDTLRLAGPEGPVGLRIAGVFYDYTTEGGAAAVDLRTVERIFGPGPLNTVALYLEAGRDPERTVDELRAHFPGLPVIFRSNRRLREEVLAIFDQTFAVTRILQGMSLLIAVSGIALTLIIQARERVAELALYRSLGARRRQIFGTFLGEGLAIGVLGLLLGAVGGAGLAVILVRYINPAWFGWTLRMDWPWGALARQAATILFAAAAAAAYPALRASRVPATELSREV